MLKPLNNRGKLTVFVDADHARDKVTRRSVTGIIVLLGNTPIVWVCKRQKTVECSTYGAELIAAQIAIELIIELRYKLRMLGVKMEKETVLSPTNTVSFSILTPNILNLYLSSMISSIAIQAATSSAP